MDRVGPQRQSNNNNNKTLIRPVVSYGTEAWTLTKKEEQALLIFERKIFRRIYGPKSENGEWKVGRIEI